jgi:excisionase family DNA binding protein
MQTTARTLLTSEEAALWLRVSPRTLYTWLRAGRVPGARRVGRRWLIDPDAIKSWLTGDSHEHAARVMIETGVNCG